MGTVHAKSADGSDNFDDSSHKPIPNNAYKMTSSKPKNPPSSKKVQSKTSSGRISIDLEEIKTRVDKVHVDGLIRTKDDIIEAQVKELFKARDFQDVIVNIHKVRDKLHSLGCFKSIWVYIDTSRGPGATPEGVEITFNVHELSRMTGGISTMVGNNEGSLLIGATAPNLFGRGEKLQMEYSRGHKSTTNFNVSVIKPFVGHAGNTVLTNSVFSTSYDFPWSGYKESDKGLLIDLTYQPSRSLKHTLQYEATYRKIMATKQASFLVREQCGPNLKSALRHVCSIDKRDASLFPTVGSLVQFSTEVAGLGGDIGFVKNEFIMQSNWTPHEYFTFQLGLQAGLLRSISNSLKINIADQFFLGGPLNLRGFDMRGCGPRHEGNAMGGDAYWSTALHVYTPLPFMSSHSTINKLFKLHGFINGGNISNFTFKFADDYRENMKLFTENVRCSVGGGIAMKLGNVARVEFNFVTPLLFLRSDVLRQFQFGIGVQYL